MCEHDPKLYLSLHNLVFTNGTPDTVSTVFIGPANALIDPVLILRITLFYDNDEFFYYELPYRMPNCVSARTKTLRTDSGGPKLVVRRDSVHRTYMFEIIRSSLKRYVETFKKEVTAVKTLTAANKLVY